MNYKIQEHPLEAEEGSAQVVLWEKCWAAESWHPGQSTELPQNRFITAPTSSIALAFYYKYWVYSCLDEPWADFQSPPESKFRSPHSLPCFSPSPAWTPRQCLDCRPPHNRVSRAVLPALLYWGLGEERPFLVRTVILKNNLKEKVSEIMVHKKYYKILRLKFHQKILFFWD